MESEIQSNEWSVSFNAGIAAMESGLVNDALTNLKRAVEIAQKNELKDELTDSLIALGDAHRMLGDFKNAETTLSQAVDFSFRNPGKNRLRYAYSLGAIGRLFVEQNRLDEAMHHLDIGVSILRRSRDFAEAQFLTVFFAQINCYLGKKVFDKADELATYTHDLSKDLLGANDPATVMALTMCIVTAEALGRSVRANSLRQEMALLMQSTGT
ncbi:MAG: tetratricopeptide repeat protein [Candidatus Obscuribacterales bacterium]|nr:tetratricopeptide repeat protein [Candidatus Obscuribacterales bacterium]